MEEVRVQQQAREPEAERKPLPLVVEILAGQAGEGLVTIFEAGTYENKGLAQLCAEALARTDLSIEERQLLAGIRRQLDGGRLLVRGEEIERRAREYAELEETEAGEKYWYVAVRALRPQEGGRALW